MNQDSVQLHDVGRTKTSGSPENGASGTEFMGLPTSVDILGVPIHVLTLGEAVVRVKQMIRSGMPHHVMTVNPEFIMIAQSHPSFRAVLKESSLNIPDGIGTVQAARILGVAVPERVAGVDLVERLAEEGRDGSIRAFLLGSGEGVARRAAEELQRRNPGFTVVGTYAGSPHPEEEDTICRLIETSRPNMLLVAYGAPNQDLWISRTQSRLKLPVAIGVGGTFDFIAGVRQRAPVWTRRIGLEWFYRLVREPSRWRRMLALPRFVVAVLAERWRRGI